MVYYPRDHTVTLRKEGKRMLGLFVLAEALEFIEARLEEPFAPEDAARACYVSLSALQKLFRHAVNLGVKEYIARRRLTSAARDLQATGARVVDVAYRYQYQSPEVFTRAFTRLWGVTPSVFRREWKFSGLFPRINDFVMGGDGAMRRKVDISELYDVLRGMRDTYALCFDMRNLTGINEISHKAGDQAIVECLRRIDGAAREDMLLFRIGGDEFALATGLGSREEVEAVARTVLAANGEPIVYEGQAIPVSMYAAGVRFRWNNLRYAELLERLQHAANDGWKKAEALETGESFWFVDPEMA